MLPCPLDRKHLTSHDILKYENRSLYESASYFHPTGEVPAREQKYGADYFNSSVKSIDEELAPRAARSSLANASKQSDWRNSATPTFPRLRSSKGYGHNQRFTLAKVIRELPFVKQFMGHTQTKLIGLEKNDKFISCLSLPAIYRGC